MFKKEKVIIKVGGMTCSNCAAHVEEALNNLIGVKAKVLLEDNQVEITTKGKVSLEDLEAAIVGAGYTVEK